MKNELCIRFVIRGQCWNAYHCPRIHPYNKRLYRHQAIEEQKRLKDLRLAQAPCASAENAPVQGAEPTTTTAPTNPVSLQSAIPQPPATTTKPIQRQSEGPSANFERNRAFAVGLTDILQQRPVRPADNQNHTVSMSGDDVHNWDTLHGLDPFSKPDNHLSDTSSISEDMSVPGKHREPCWDPETGFWENYTDNKAWSDSDVTTDDMQMPSVGRRNPHSVPQSRTTDGTQALPVKHPRPKINDRCRRWLRNECNLGYQCRFVHEDLEYDPPVSFDLSPCQHSCHVRIFNRNPRDTLKVFQLLCMTI